MKTKMTLFSAAKQGFAVCDVEYTEPRAGSSDIRIISITDRATGLPLDIDSVLRWHTQSDINTQAMGLKEKPASQLTESEPAKFSSVIPEDCPKKLRRFYEQDATPALPNLGWD